MLTQMVGDGVPRSPERRGAPAIHAVVTALGLVAAFAGVERGVGELTQPSGDHASIVIESWPHVEAFAPLSGEPAMTLIPDLRVSGLVTIVASVALGWWSVRARAHRRDGWVLLSLSVLLLLVGGGFGPPVLGLLLSTALIRAASDGRRRPGLGRVRRGLASRWRLLLVLAVVSFLALFPGVVLLRWWTGLDASWLPALLGPLAFTSLILTLVAALTFDRIAAVNPRAAT